MTDHDDKELVRLFHVEGKRNYAFNLIVRKFQERLYWHIRKIVIKHDDADDVIQNTFIKAYQGLDKFREDASLFTWLYRIATNESISFLKKQKNIYSLPLGEYQDHLEANLAGDGYTDGEDIQFKLQQAVLRLPEKQRLVFNMKYFDDLKYEEMSQILNTSVGALKASYHHAVKKIQKYITDD